MAGFEAACAAIDRANSADPRRSSWEGGEVPHEVLYSELMTRWVRRLRPDASEELLLAARAQHIRRWESPREKYPPGQKGYLQWRETLKQFHADALAKIMREAGYPDASIEKSRTLLLRKNFAEDPEGQTLEDAACLVFLEMEFAEFSSKTDEAKMVEILKKSWGKMSPAAHQAALRLPLGAHERALVEKALE